MEQYIDKSALVAEIERLKTNALQKKEQCKRRGLEKIMRQIGAYNKVLSFVDTLEVKEVDLEKETKKWWKEHLHLDPKNQLWMDAHQSIVFAEHFFELGMQVSNKAQKGEEV